MAHAIWSGSINFGLVTIPVKLQTAVRTNDLRFNFLHKADEGRIQNVRRCSLDGEDVSYDDIVRGYEYEKGHYVILSDDDFQRVNVEATQSVDIVQFVELDEINPMYYDKPYYLEPEKKGRHAYALLREALKAMNKVGIAKVVIRSREHLAAVKPNGEALVLELMHFADEIVDADHYDLPETEKPHENEMKVAKLLIDTMTAKFEPDEFHDTYREQLLAMIEARAAGKSLPTGKPKARKASNVVNLMDVLQKSLEQTRAKHGGGRLATADEEEKPKRASRRKKSAA
ncbi:MAG: Ku protein [Candidatus Eremiobacteraeota bacterium]|nr:Ku protein [Candidatus Eremiobacteraeota bacterium]